MRILLFILLTICVLACDPTKKGALSPEVRSELDRMTERSNMNTEAKYDTLAARISVLLQEAMAKRLNSDMVAHLRDFEEENELALKNLRIEFDQWYWRMDDDERTQLALKYQADNSPPFARNLPRLIPRARRRLNNNPQHVAVLDRIIRNIQVSLY